MLRIGAARGSRAAEGQGRRRRDALQTPEKTLAIALLCLLGTSPVATTAFRSGTGTGIAIGHHDIGKGREGDDGILVDGRRRCRRTGG